MERITISVSDEFAAELAAFMEREGYDNRSEAVRDLARLGLNHARIDHNISGDCVATLSYVFNHHIRELAKRLMDAHHEHHGDQLATMHVHLDHDNCLEVAVLRGDAAKVREFAKINRCRTRRHAWSGQFRARLNRHSDARAWRRAAQARSHPSEDLVSINWVDRARGRDA